MKSFRVVSCVGLLAALGACGGSSLSTSSTSSGTGGTGGSNTTSGAPSGTGGSNGCSDAGAPTCTPSGYTVDQSNASRTPLASVPAATLEAAVTANNAFTVDLYKHVVADAATAAGNVITSPFSASIALTMTYAGAAGTTATQMQSALHFASTPSIFDGQSALLQTLAGRAASAYNAGKSSDSCPSDYEVQIANSVWGQKTFAWESSFLDVLARSYGTGLYLADFTNQFEPARDAINKWVSCETAGQVPTVLPPMSLNQCTAMVLVDAIHLKLPWQTPFSKAATSMKPFTNGAGAVVMSNFMHQTETFPYVDDGNAQVVALPLGDGNLSVVIALPHGDLAAYEAALTTGAAALTIPSMGSEVDLSLPKFAFKSPIFSLGPALQAMGMVDAFGDNANFTGLLNPEPTFPACCPQVLQIASVLQKATMAVEESGVEAAAATAVVLSAVASGTGPLSPPVPMNVNKPFVFSVVDATGAVLFVGHVQDPTVTMSGKDWKPPAGGC